MIPNTLFLKQPPKFWAYVRSISQEFGYSVHKKGQIKGKRQSIPSGQAPPFVMQ